MEKIQRNRHHEGITRILRDEILKTYNVGDKLPPEVQLSFEFRVSRNTVREALAILDFEGFIKRYQGSGVYVQNWHELLPVAIYIGFDVYTQSTSFYYLRLINQLRLIFRERIMHSRVYSGYEPHFVQTVHNRKQLSRAFPKDIASGKVCGVIHLSGDMPKAWADTLARKRLPLVHLHALEEDDMGFVSNYAERSCAAMRLLREQGCRRIAVVEWAGPEITSKAHAASMRNRLSNDIHLRDIELDPSLFRGSIHPSLEGAFWDNFESIWNSTHDKPDGLFIGDDDFLRELTAVIYTKKIKVPEDLRIVAFTNRGRDIRLPFPIGKIEINPDKQAEMLAEIFCKSLKRERINEPNMSIPFEVIPAGQLSPTSTAMAVS